MRAVQSKGNEFGETTKPRAWKLSMTTLKGAETSIFLLVANILAKFDVTPALTKAKGLKSPKDTRFLPSLVRYVRDERTYSYHY